MKTPKLDYFDEWRELFAVYRTKGRLPPEDHQRFLELTRRLHDALKAPDQPTKSCSGKDKIDYA